MSQNSSFQWEPLPGCQWNWFGFCWFSLSFLVGFIVICGVDLFVEFDCHYFFGCCCVGGWWIKACCCWIADLNCGRPFGDQCGTFSISEEMARTKDAANKKVLQVNKNHLEPRKTYFQRVVKKNKKKHETNWIWLGCYSL